MPHLFERFHRVSGARSRTHEGSGIGLALVAELVALHGGTVRSTSVVEGSTFTMRLPYGAAHLPPEQLGKGRDGASGVGAVAQGYIAETTHWSDPTPAATCDTGPGDTGAPRILLVDDNADIREYVAGLLAGDYIVRTAVDGVDGWRRRRRPPDLVLTDVMMPRMDGFELLRELQADPLRSACPVVMLSARAGEEGTAGGPGRRRRRLPREAVHGP